jgi:hypothetical protein
LLNLENMHITISFIVSKPLSETMMCIKQLYCEQ